LAHRTARPLQRPASSKQLQFSLESVALNADNVLPADVFEVALLDSVSNLPVVGTTGLPNSDSLLNIQPDGRVFFADSVDFPGVDSSGDIWNFETPVTVTIDLTSLSDPGEATRQHGWY
jgi:hypothetical protein